MKKTAFYTLGCKVNQYETEAMSELFANAGYEITDFSDKADIMTTHEFEELHIKKIFQQNTRFYKNTGRL